MTARTVRKPKNFEVTAWTFMRYSGILLIPLAWIHVLIKDVIVGVHGIDLNYVQRIWALTAWRVYDFFLLAFAFAHGMNGLRNVLNDYISDPAKQRVVAWVLLILWAVVTVMGAVAIIGGVRMP